MKPYTVVVLYPVFACDGDYPLMTYVAHVTAPDVRRAQAAGQGEAMRAQPNARRGVASDWAPLVTFPGYVTPECYAWDNYSWRQKR